MNIKAVFKYVKEVKPFKDGIIIDEFPEYDKVSLKKALKIRLEKSAATMVMGSIRRWGAKQIAHKKTPKGWMRVKEGSRPQTSRSKLKSFYKEMREEHGGGWIGPALVRNKMNFVRLLAKEGKAEVEELGQGHYRVRFLKSFKDFGE